MPSDAPLLAADDLLAAAAWCREALAPAVGAYWTVPAGDLD